MEIKGFFKDYKLLDSPSLSCPDNVQAALDTLNNESNGIKLTFVAYFGASGDNHLLVCKKGSKIVLTAIGVSGVRPRVIIYPIGVPDSVQQVFDKVADTKTYKPVAYMGRDNKSFYVLCQETHGDKVFAATAEVGDTFKAQRMGSLGYAFTW